MFFSFAPKSSVLLVFFLHGILFSILLFVKARQTDNRPSFWLSLFTLLCSLYIAPFMFGYAGWYSRVMYRDLLFYIPFQQLFLLPPILYFYFKSLLDKSFTFSAKDYVHFIPATLYLLYTLVVFVTDKIILQEYYFYSDGKDKDFSTWYQIAGIISMLYYLIRSLKTYNRYTLITYNVSSYADSVMFTWAKRFLIAFLLLISLRILFFILNPEWGEFGKKFWYYVCFSILYYYISISGYTNSILSTTSFKDSTVPNEDRLAADDIPLTNDVPENADTPSIPEEKAALADLDFWKAAIEKLMLTESLFENPELVISDVSSALHTHTKKVSQIINQGFGKNFNDYVNDHRSMAVIKKIEAGEHLLQTLLGIAFDCGFNSKSTFNRAFKRFTGLNPKEYIEKHHPK